MKLVSPTKKPIKLDPIRANAGVEAKYRKALQELVGEMSNSFIYWTRAAWKKEPPVLAQDKVRASFVDLRRTMERLGRYWQRRFDSIAPELAKVFVDGATMHTDAAMMAILKKAGFTVRFQMTLPACQAYQAVLQENVGLIRSISSEYLQEVQGHVWQAVKSGYDLETLTDTLKSKYGVTHKRAAFISRDQTNKAKAVIEKVRRQELGLKQAEWEHSGAGKHPRPSHLKAGRDKLVYDLDKGAYLDGKWVLPGEEPNCRCTSRALIPGFED